MFDLETIRAAVTVGAGVTQLIASIVEHLQGQSAVNVRPALNELAESIPDLVHAVRSGTVAEAEVGADAEGDEAAPEAGDEQTDEAPAAEGSDPGDETEATATA
jgi:hypothetical protein